MRPGPANPPRPSQHASPAKTDAPFEKRAFRALVADLVALACYLRSKVA